MARPALRLLRVHISTTLHKYDYRSGPVNSTTVNSKLKLNSNFLKDLFAKLLLFHV